MGKFFSDFKKFALKGNIIDMAVGVVIGGAFGKIVTSLVSDIISPLISFATGRVTLANLKYVIKAAEFDAAGVELVPESAILYGNFIQTIIDFLIIALSIFVVLRIFMTAQNKMEELKKKEEEAAEEAPAAPAETELSLLKDILAEIKKDKTE